jgi:outer membrane protein OmpA-like peptidoglycan-associated protein
MSNRHQVQAEDETNFWPVYADLAMVMLLIFFLFMLAQFVITKLLVDINPAAKEMRETQKKIIALFKSQERFNKVEAQEPDGAKQAFLFKADVLFKPDDATLRDTGQSLLTDFCDVILDYAGYYDRIEIEGHADSHPSALFYHRNSDLGQDHGNWRLSAERAITVAQLFQQRGDPQQIGKQLAVVGRSFYDPARPEDGNTLNRDLAREQNRRIVIRLYYSETKITKKLKEGAKKSLKSLEANPPSKSPPKDISGLRSFHGCLPAA